MNQGLELLKLHDFSEEQLGVILAIAARGTAIVPGLLSDLQASAQDGSLLARDVLAAHAAADEALQQLAAEARAARAQQGREHVPPR